MSAQRPTFAEINLAALRHNLAQVQNHLVPDQEVLAVVKADAYGHGAVPVARALRDCGVGLFAVALLEEALELRQAGIDEPLLVLGGLYPGQEEAILEHGLRPCLFDLAAARRLDRLARTRKMRCPVHVKIDTGMSRVGFRLEEFGEALKVLTALPGLIVEGVCSHLALADEPEHRFNDEQVKVFRQALAMVDQAGLQPAYIHLSNSAAIFSRQLPECNLVRAGIALYGGLPSEHFAGRIDLQPVMNLRTRIAQLKQVPPGAGVSYGHRFVAERKTLLAVLPIGYADGYNRLLSNCGEVLIRGQRARVAGTVCMDWTLVDVTDVPGVCLGDEVTLLGRSGDQMISGEEWAGKVESISYEVFCRISRRVPRKYQEAGFRSQESGETPES